MKVEVDIRVNEEIVLEKTFEEGTSTEEISEKLSFYIKAEQLTKLGKVTLSIKGPKHA